MKKDRAYYPSALNIRKYSIYFKYLIEYIKYGDWNSVKASFGYLLGGRPPTRPWIANSKMGTFSIRKGTNDFLFINYTYEQKVRDYLEKNSNHITHFIDIGACIGEFCVWLTEKGIQCYAFEPVNYKIALENFELNQMADKIKLYNHGLGDEERKVFFDVKQVVTSSSRMDKSRKDEEGNIPISTLDKVFPRGSFSNDDHVVIKLDVEGMELEVIEGGKRLIGETKHLEIIFEHTVSGSDPIREKLDQIGAFKYTLLDEVNILAVKQ